mgnify:CR=1 FL=1
MWDCPNCGKMKAHKVDSYFTPSRDLIEKYECLNCHYKFEKIHISDKGMGASGWWWLVPFLFGILGGIIAYLIVKDNDEDMASKLLTFGIVWSIVLGTIMFVAVF